LFFGKHLSLNGERLIRYGGMFLEMQKPSPFYGNMSPDYV